MRTTGSGSTLSCLPCGPLVLAGLLVPDLALAADPPAAAFRFMDLLTLLTLFGVGFLALQWQQRIKEDRKTQTLLHRMLERRVGEGPTASSAATAKAGATGTAARTGAAASAPGASLPFTPGTDIDNQAVESPTTLEAATPADALQKLHRDAVAGLERLYATQSGLVSAVEALKAGERRDATVLAELRAGLSLINSRLVERNAADTSTDPTVIGSPEETPRPMVSLSHFGPLQEMLDVQGQTLEAQVEMIEAQGSTLSRLAKDLERQDAERNQTVQLLQKLTSRVKGIEKSIDHLARVESELSRVQETATGIEALQKTLASAEDLRQLATGVDEMRRAMVGSDNFLELAVGVDELRRTVAAADDVRQLATGLEALKQSLAAGDDVRQLAEGLDALRQSVAAGEDLRQVASSLSELRQAVVAGEDLRQLTAGVDALRQSVAAGEDLRQLATGMNELKQAVAVSDDLRKLVTDIDHLRRTMAAGDDLRELSARLEDLRGSLETGDDLRELTEGVEEVRQLANNLKSLPQLEQGLAQLQQLSSGLDRLKRIEHGIDQLQRLEEQSDALSEQLGELQADIGLVLKARPVRGAGRSRSPYDVTLAEEYYTNLQKVIKGLVKNDKASTYAIEASQYLFESLQVQAALCELLSSAEFALRINPKALEEGVVKPLARMLGPRNGLAQKPLVTARPAFKPEREESQDTALAELERLVPPPQDWEESEGDEGELPVRLAHSH